MEIPNSLFDAEKAAEVAGLFLDLNGGQADSTQIVKWVYFAEREFLKRYTILMLKDQPESWPHGPVVKNTYQCMTGGIFAPEWDASISGRVQVDDFSKKIALKKNVTLKKLNEAEKETIENIYTIWGQYGAKELSDITHDGETFPEWENPGTSSRPISLITLLKILGKSEDEIAALKEQLEYQNAFKDLEKEIGLKIAT